MVTRWFVSIGENEGTRKIYVWWLAMFCMFTGWNPAEILEVKRENMLRGKPMGEVEDALRDFYFTLGTAAPPPPPGRPRKKAYAHKSRSLAVTACYSFLGAHGFRVPKKLIRLSRETEKEIRLLERREIEGMISQAGTLEKSSLFTVMAECPARPRVFPAMRWGWLEADWYERDVVHVSLPKQFRPARGGGPVKFEPICYIGPRGILMLKKLRDELIKKGRPPLPSTQIFPSCPYKVILHSMGSAYGRAAMISDVHSHVVDDEETEKITPKSFRKFVFNIIDGLKGISPEWRAMLKGRDLGVEKYYSKENIEALRKIYREEIYPAIWDASESKKPQTRESILKYLAENFSEIHDLLSEREGKEHQGSLLRRASPNTVAEH